MRYKTFKRQNLQTGRVSIVAFSEDHYLQAGLFPSLLGGMAQLEAHQLINKWNAARTVPRFLYTL